MQNAINILLNALVLNLLLLGAGSKKDIDKNDADQNSGGKYSFSNSAYTGIAQLAIITSRARFPCGPEQAMK